MSSVILYFNTAIVLAVPILMVAVGVCYSEKSGVYGMNADSSMLGACFTGVLVMLATGNAFLSMLVGVLTGAVIARLFSIFAVRIGANQCLIGLGFNFMVMGLTSSILRLITETGTGIPQFKQPGSVAIPLLSKIPVVGGIIFNQPITVYMIYAIIPISWWILFKSTWGLKIRSVGENPRCADSLGINVIRTRTIAVTVGGAFAGFGGAILAVQQVGTFTDEMTGSRAWMGIICAYFGGWSPLGSTFAALVFGLASALEKRIQLLNLPISSYMVQMFPYIAAILVICLTGRNRRHPAAMARYYQKQ